MNTMRIKIKRKKDRKTPDRQDRHSPWQLPCRWVALGTLAAYGSVGEAGMAYAQNVTNGAAHSEAQSPAALPTRRFDIPPGPLEMVLESFGSVSGLQVQFANEGLRSLPSPGVSGVYTVDQALNCVVSGARARHRPWNIRVAWPSSF